MNLPDLSIKRPIFITCIFFLILVLGGLSFTRLGVDLFPNVSFPIVAVSIAYPGAGPQEIETLVSKPIEDSLSTLSGLDKLQSINTEGISTIVAQFTLETDIKYAEQQIRDRISSLRSKLPDDIIEPIIRTFDPADQPILNLSITAKLPPARLYDVANDDIRPLIEQAKDVGFVEVVGGRKREVQVLLDMNKLKLKSMSASQVSARIGAAGKNIPAGKATSHGKESNVRTLGEFESLKDIQSTLINFYGNETPIRVGDVAEVKDSLEEEKTRTFVNGVQGLTLSVYRRSGANTLAVVDAVKERVAKINRDFKDRWPEFQLSVVVDGGKPILTNVNDVKDSIIIGIVLTILVVFFFLGSGRSTLITSIALPNSLLGAFVLMAAAGFTINLMTLLALSLAVGLLVDDAIVVRENIFRHIELGKSPKEAASFGTKQVALAVVATTLTVISVFGPVAFLEGMVGQFFKEFGLTICFALAISLMDSLTMAPMLSAYFAGNLHSAKKKTGLVTAVLDGFDRLQNRLESLYVRTLKFTLRKPFTILGSAVLIFFLSFFALAFVPKSFMPSSDTGEFMVAMDMAPGTDLENMSKAAFSLDKDIRAHREVKQTVLMAGDRNGVPNKATIYVQLVPTGQRQMNTSAFKDKVREDIRRYSQVTAKVQDSHGLSGDSHQGFMVNIVGTDMNQLVKTATELYEKIKNNPNLKDVDISYRPGNPEFRVVIDKGKAQQLGVSSTIVGQELRTQIEGIVPAVFRESGKEYDIRVRLKDDQKNLKENFPRTFVPNINNRLIRLADVARPIETEGPATIYRQDRGRYIQVSADMNPNGEGMAKVMEQVRTLMDSGQVKLPEGVRYQFMGQAEEFGKLARSILFAAVLAIVFIYLVLASLYESFVTPFTIMLVLPLAACGAFYALAMTHASLDVFSMIGCIMLLGIATKNSILLVDYTRQLTAQGMDMASAIIEAGRTRLRPILMTSFALIAGMLPIAIGLNEASKQRTSMGIAVIGGLISSTILTLVVVPAAYSYIERFRLWTLRLFGKVATSAAEDPTLPGALDEGKSRGEAESDAEIVN